MSDTLTIDTDGAPAPRRSRAERAARRGDRERDRDDDEPTTTIEGLIDLSPEATLADTASQLRAQTRAAEEHGRAARESERRAQQAEQQLAATRNARTGDAKMVVGAALETAKATQSSARMELRAARESGDVEAEIAATEKLSSATYQYSQAADELQRLETAPPAQQPQQTGRPSEHAQRWIDNHPLFNDPTPAGEAYKASAVGAHSSAIAAGRQEGSREYVDYIDGIMSRIYGRDHGRIGDDAAPDRRTEMDRPARGARDAVPPSRGEGGRGQSKIETLIGPLIVRTLANGQTGVTFTSRDQQENATEAAQFSKMDLREYVMDQLAIAKERSEGGTGDLVHGDGEVHR